MWCHREVAWQFTWFVSRLAISILGMVFGIGFIDPPMVEADTKVVPSLYVYERYDSNVYYGPQSLVPDKKLWDFVTVVAPEAKVQHRSELIEGDLKVGATGTTYINNPGLNFFSTNAVLRLNLDNSIRKLMERMRLEVDDYLQYTPEQPAFLTPKAEGPADAVLIGLQAFRANALVNAGRARGFYDISPTLSIHGTYLNTIYRFGEVFIGTGLFTTTTHTASAGPQIRLTSRDTAKLSYSYSANQIGDVNFTTNTIEAEYTRDLTPRLSATMNAGVTQIQPGKSIHPVGTAELEWRLSENERWKISFTRSVTANFFLNPAPMVSQRISAWSVHQFTGRLTMKASVNYAHNETTDPPVARFVSYGTDLDFRYVITRHLSASFEVGYGNFDFFGFKYDRNTVGFSISSTWP